MQPSSPETPSGIVHRERNDLFAVVMEHPEYHSDGMHFTREGQAALGCRVAEVIAR